jgi:GDPmannose 4,6-dehydratase
LKKALIIGITGQDGAFLARFLLEKGYKVYGTSRDIEASSLSNLKKLNIDSDIHLMSMSLIDFRRVMQVIFEIEPDEIYNLGGQTSVGLSFSQPVETFESISTGTLNILELLRFHKLPIKFYNASSSECFGDTLGKQANESTTFQPRSPYAIAKCTAFWQVSNYREAYNIFACSGILFNHESFLRPNRFVTMKILHTAIRIFKGSEEKLTLGNIKIQRDWGWAPEYVEAMYLMLQEEKADDFVIATGLTISLEQVIEHIFNRLNLNYKDYLVQDPQYFRPTDILSNHGDPSKALNTFNWASKIKGLEVFDKMLEYELSKG